MKKRFFLYIVLSFCFPQHGFCLIPFKAFDHPDSIRAMDWNESGDRLATLCRDGFVRIWNIKTGKQELSLDVRIDIDRLATNQVPSTMDWMGNHIALVYNDAWQHGRDSYIAVWDIGQEQLIQQHAVNDLAYLAKWHPDGQRVFVAAQQGFHSFPFDDGDMALEFSFADIIDDDSLYVSVIKFDDRNRLIWGTRGGFEGGQGSIYIWDTESQTMLWHYDGIAVNSLDIRDGLLLSGHGGRFDRPEANVWSIDDGESINNIRVNLRGQSEAFFIRDPNRFIAGLGDLFRVFDVYTGSIVHETNGGYYGGGMWTPSSDRIWLAMADGVRGNGQRVLLFRIESLSALEGWERYQ